jgi:rhodanese-related sulfurtransferase
MKTLLIVLLFVVILILIRKKNKLELTLDEAVEAIKNNEFDYIIDVRTKQEWDEGHYPTAIHIPIGEFVSLLPEKIPDRNARILFYCKKGIRASGTTVIAQKLGYKNIKYLDGRYADLAKIQ